MPDYLIIGTQKAFQYRYAFRYKKTLICSETVYVSTKGSNSARAGEILVLRCEGTIWTAYDSALTADGTTLQCRQPVFRSQGSDITQSGWHNWARNHEASPNHEGLTENWASDLWALTQVTSSNEPQHALP